MAENFVPDFRVTDGKQHGFFTIFAIFFPSATGITAGEIRKLIFVTIPRHNVSLRFITGANISADLKVTNH